MCFVLQHEYHFHSLLCTVVAVLHYPLCVLFHNRNIIFFCSVYSSCCTPLLIAAFISQQEYQFLSVLCIVVALLHYQLWLLFHNRNIILFCSVYSGCFTPLPIVAFISQQEYQFLSVLCTVVAVFHYQLCVLFHSRNISFFLVCVQ